MNVAGSQNAHRAHIPRSVTELMSAPPLTIEPGDRLDLAYAAMMHRGVRHLPVTQQGRLRGVLSLRDVLSAGAAAWSAGEEAVVACLHETTVASTMASKPFVAAPEEDIIRAGERLLQRHISCLPVVEDECVVGIVTLTDYVRLATILLREESSRRGRGILAEQLMTPSPVSTVRPGDTLLEVSARMRSEQHRHMVVMERNRIVGMLSDRDVLAALPGGGLRGGTLALLVGDVMTSPAITIAAETDAASAGGILLDRRLGALPVERRQQLVGLLSVSDFLSYVVSWTPSARA